VTQPVGNHGHGFGDRLRAVVMSAQISGDARDQSLSRSISARERLTLRPQLASLPAREQRRQTVDFGAGNGKLSRDLGPTPSERHAIRKRAALRPLRRRQG
jgi:hypothetical protein